MKNRFSSLLLLVSMIVSTLPVTGAWAGADGYNSAQTYPGQYKADAVYYRNPKNPNWYQGLNGTYPKNVLCKDALNNFMSNGKWKGHFKADGSCGPTAEPSEFAVGNRINYDASKNAGR
jgi:hypothetical protein